MPDLWPSSGYRLLKPDAQGHLAVTDDFLRAYLTRPEIAPVEESRDAEHTLHAELLADPRMVVAPARLAALGDPDAEENYRIVLSFRDRLVQAGTVEACYRGLFGGGRAAVPVPPLFVDQLAHVITRNILDGTDDRHLFHPGHLLQWSV